MALDYTTDPLYTGRIDLTDAPNYPYGKFQDETAEGANDGSQHIAKRANDPNGFLQYLLVQGGITPSATPDTAQVSQYWQGAENLINALISNALSTATRLTPSTEAGSSLSVDSTDHLSYISMTNAGAITVNALVASAPFGDMVSIKKAPGSGDITFAGSGTTVNVPSGGSLVLDTDGAVATLISRSATQWDLIK